MMSRLKVAADVTLCVCIAAMSFQVPIAVGQPDRARPGSTGSMPSSVPPPLEMTGYLWAENLDFDGKGNLFVSDSETGEIWRIWWSGSAWTQEVYFDDARAALGLATDDEYLFANITSLNNEHQVVRMPLGEVDPVAEVLATLPLGANGLERDQDGALYATTEGNFIPGQGAVYRIVPGSGWTVFVDGLWAANGIAIDAPQRLMYVSQVVNNKVLVIRLPDGEILQTLPVSPPNGCLLDDIALNQEGTLLYGADFGRGDVYQIPLNGESPSILFSGLDHATSLLLGDGPSFNATSLYVTEGGGFLDFDREQRVLELPLNP